jgi:hypothetical protein
MIDNSAQKNNKSLKSGNRLQSNKPVRWGLLKDPLVLTAF